MDSPRLEFIPREACALVGNPQAAVYFCVCEPGPNGCEDENRCKCKMHNVWCNDNCKCHKGEKSACTNIIMPVLLHVEVAQPAQAEVATGYSCVCEPDSNGCEDKNKCMCKKNDVPCNRLCMCHKEENSACTN